MELLKSTKACVSFSYFCFGFGDKRLLPTDCEAVDL